jgi:hypothetical protein
MILLPRLGANLLGLANHYQPAPKPEFKRWKKKYKEFVLEDG